MNERMNERQMNESTNPHTANKHGRVDYDSAKTSFSSHRGLEVLEVLFLAKPRGPRMRLVPLLRLGDL
jgi:hypothetical protein